ncbi:MAG TPA: hypothetical protein VHN80_30260 [Kineosporiaceae bacterium]|jgi:uncharacterized protein YegP (UPF0339 family)|nr:hypothetical protein [Kineosporiaceae bacterium]
MEPRYQCFGEGPGWSWRLLGSNHRALARSARTFLSQADATADALEVGQLAPDAEIELLTEHGSNWRWQMTVNGSVRATSATGYARRLECVRAVARYRRCAPLAAVSAAPLLRGAGSSRARATAAQSTRDTTTRLGGAG